MFSCSLPLYLHNNSCISCDHPLIKTSSISGVYSGVSLGYCISPCEPDMFIYPDGSCFNTCNLMFTIITNSTGKFCLNPCPVGEIVCDQNWLYCSIKLLIPFGLGSLRFGGDLWVHLWAWHDQVSTNKSMQP